MYRALIVCNSQFRDDPSLSDLYGPQEDGLLLRDALTDQSSGMFSKESVRLVQEAPSHQLCDAVEEFFQSAGHDDTLLFYYSGHGITRYQQLFLCAANTNIEKPHTTAIAESTVSSVAANSYARAKIIILDCCHSGMLKSSELAQSLMAGSLDGTGRYVIAAASATERASDARFRGMPSPFTRILTEGLTDRAADRDGDGYVDLDDIYFYLERTPYDGPRPQRRFDGEGTVSIARRIVSTGMRPSGDEAAGDDHANGDDLSQELSAPTLSYLDTAAPRSAFSPELVSQFRANIRGENSAQALSDLSAEDFLESIGVMRDRFLTYAGVLLFGKNPNSLFPAAVIQCARFHGSLKTDPLETIDLRGTISDVIVGARDFVARNARIGEAPTSQSAFAEPTYRYPMVAVREIIANAVVHRDYEDQSSCVQIHMFDDRVEVINPGQWGGTPTAPEGESPLSQLERRSQRRNFRLAHILGMSKLVEGVGAGVPRAVADSRAAGAEEPAVIIDDRAVLVTIFPGTLEPARSQPQRPDPDYQYQPPAGAPPRRTRDQPHYRVIAEDLRARIQSGTFGAGDKLPNEQDLMFEYDASRNTVREAVKRLADAGLVETRPGRGTFVASQVDPFVTRLTANPRTGFGGGEGAAYLSQLSRGERLARATAPRVEVHVAPAEIAARLAVPPRTQVIARHQERHIDLVPWSAQTSYYPMEFVSKGASRLLIAQDIEEGTIRYLAESIDVRQTGYRDWLTGRRANKLEQEFFAIGDDATVFVIYRVAFDQHGAPMRVTATSFPTTRSQFIVDVGGDLPEPAY